MKDNRKFWENVEEGELKQNCAEIMKNLETFRWMQDIKRNVRENRCCTDFPGYDLLIKAYCLWASYGPMPIEILTMCLESDNSTNKNYKQTSIMNSAVLSHLRDAIYSFKVYLEDSKEAMNMKAASKEADKWTRIFEIKENPEKDAILVGALKKRKVNVLVWSANQVLNASEQKEQNASEKAELKEIQQEEICEFLELAVQLIKGYNSMPDLYQTTKESLDEILLQRPIPKRVEKIVAE